MIKLFEKDSVEDLLLRGYGDVYIRRTTNISMRLHKSEYLKKLENIDRNEYCGMHIKTRLKHDFVIDALKSFADNNITLREIKSQFGIAWKTEKECDLSIVMDFAGYGIEYCESISNRKNAIQNAITQTNMNRYGGKSPMADSSVREKIKTTTILNYGVENISQAECIKEKKRQTTLINHGVEYSFQSSEIRDKAKDTIRERYGVDNVSKSDEIKKKKAETTFSHFGVENSLQSQEVRNKIAASLRQNHGITDESAVSPFQIPEILEKTRETCYERYGVENIFESAEIQEKIKQHWMFKYGVANPSQVLEIQQKRVLTMLERFGVENPFMNPDIQEKSRQTNLERYGVEYASQNANIKERVKNTNLERYGVEYTLQSDIIREHIRETNLEKYGAECVLQSEIIREQIKKTNLERYGVESPLQSDEIRERIKQTNIERYGVESPFQSDEIREHIKQINLERYGVENVMQSNSIKQKVSDRKRENGTFNTSMPEESLLEILVSKFGEDDVLTQYNSDKRYPFHCDFYIKSRDMFIELNAFWMHGYCWFDENSIASNITLEDWMPKLNSKQSKSYKSAVHTWTVHDVLKRKYAQDNHLNYITFWDSNLDDARLWFAMRCPDGQDWKEEYSWLPKREISFTRKLPEILSSAKWITAAVKAVNGNVFYKNEIKAWNENLPMTGGKLQGKLYANRFKYLNKLPNELTDAEILRGLSISRLVKDNYSSFDVDAMLETFIKYDVKSVYDPCAGWGERLLACGINNIAYAGCDINKELHTGYHKLINHYKLNNVSVVCDDSSKYDATNYSHDTVFTCPPYGNREIYTDAGAENLDDEDFLIWWNGVVKHSISSTTKYFMYQIDKKHRDSMNDVLSQNGLIFVEEVIAADSTRHENKAKGKHIRDNYEVIQVFAIT